MQSLLTAEQLAPILGVGIEQVRKLTREGSLPHHRIGGAIRYDLEAVKAATASERLDAADFINEIIDTAPISMMRPDWIRGRVDGAIRMAVHSGLITDEQGRGLFCKMLVTLVKTDE